MDGIMAEACMGDLHTRIPDDSDHALTTTMRHPLESMEVP